MSLSASENSEIYNFIVQHRQNIQVQDSQEMLVGIAWTTPTEKKFFYLYPEVLFVDVIKGTNNEKRPLLTITGKTPQGKMFFILRSFLPNERAWVFHWVLQNFMSTLFNNNVLHRIKLIISDGYSSEFSQIDDAICRFFSKCI